MMMMQASHIQCPGTEMIPVSAFRFCPARDQVMIICNEMMMMMMMMMMIIMLMP